MGMVTFLKPDLREPLTVQVRSQEKRTLLSLLTQLKLFDYRVCDRECCGACAVKVVPLTRGRKPLPVHLGSYEKTALFEAGKLSREQYETELVQASPFLWRLPCQYVVRYEEILVAV